MRDFKFVTTNNQYGYQDEYYSKICCFDGGIMRLNAYITPLIYSYHTIEPKILQDIYTLTAKLKG